MAGLCEGGNEPPGSLKAKIELKTNLGKLSLDNNFSPHLWSNGQRVWLRNQVARFESRSGQVIWLRFFPGFSLNPTRANAGFPNLVTMTIMTLVRMRGVYQHRVKMAEFTVQQKVKCCYWLKFPFAVQRRFRQENDAKAPERQTIVKWYNQLLETGSVSRKKGSGKKAVSAVKVEDNQAFQRNPRKSIRRASSELGIPKSTVHIVHKILRIGAYKIQLVQKLQLVLPSHVL
ncbi:hypothetical protein ANN_11267 [Periplaneta americana]|uniref:DUF4817 domain-containing protein n=1 Tax=Periplaneta americana TaxID=6978 RepID=A0ABQ8T683_PERAM|nr:hypothetical protein ANN_11267 [Periplaneta americana]